MKTININLFGGPGIGKSQTLSGIFNEMKMRGYNVDITLEYAKELVYAKEWTRLSDQLAVAGEQHHRMFRLQGNVKYAIHDSPFIMGIQYCKDSNIPITHFNDFLIQQFNKYNNINILLIRNPELEYKTDGRIHNEEESIIIDKNIKDLLIKNNITFHEIKVQSDIIQQVCNYIERL